MRIGDRVRIKNRKGIILKGIISQIYWTASSCSGVSYIREVDVLHDDELVRRWSYESIEVI